MKQIERKYLLKLISDKGYEYVRSSGSHDIYKNSDNRTISIPYKLKSVVGLRLIKEYELLK